MRKNIIKKALAIATAAIVGIMSVPFIPSSAAAEVYTADMVITEASATPFTFEASKNIIETGETLLVSIYDTTTGEKWDGEELPEYVIEDESVLSVSAGESNGTFVITGLTAGTTYIRFTNESSAYADFKITVKQAPTGSTTAAAIIGMSFEPASPQLAVGETITIDMYDGIGDSPYTSDFPIYIIEDPSIVSIAPGQTASTLEMTGLSAGTTKIHFVPSEGTADMRVIVTEDGTVTTTTTTTTTTVTADTADIFTTTTTYGIQLACSEEEVSLYAGDTLSFYLYYKTGPTSFSDSYPVTFEFENEGIAAVTPDPDGGSSDYIIEALSEGATKLTIKQQYGNDTLICEMNITVLAHEITDVTTTTTTSCTLTTIGLELDRTELEVMIGEEEAVNIIVEGGGNPPSFVIEDESIAAVVTSDDRSVFYVQGLAEGTTTIKVTDGDMHSVYLKVTVVSAEATTAPTETTTTTTTTLPVMGIVLSRSEIELEAGQRTSIHISKTDGSDYFDGNFVQCTLDNPEVAVVQYSDIPYEIFIVGMAEGTANITVYDPVYGSTANLQVTVTGTADNTIGNGASIVIDSEPLKLQYNIGEELDLTGGMYRVVNASTGDDIYGPYDMTTGRIMTDAFDSTTAGTYPVYISYNNPIYGYWDVYVFYVTVNDPDAVNTGDIDANGKIDLDDAVAALTCYAKNAAGIATTTPPEADVDGNGKVDLDDAVYILTYYARNAAGLPCTWDDIITG